MTEQRGINAKLMYDNNRKYWLRLLMADFEDRLLPDELMNILQKKSFIECQTLELIKINRRIDDAPRDSVIISDEIINNIRESIQYCARHLFEMCEAIALLDVLASFGQVITVGDYVRPQITGSLAMKAARHPILDTLRAPRPTQAASESHVTDCCVNSRC